MSVAPLSRQAVSTPSLRMIDIRGAVDMRLTHKNRETGLARLYYCDPLKVLFPKGDLFSAVLVTTGGGLFGGDRYDIDIHLDPETQALITAQAAEKVYRSAGEDCLIDVNLLVEQDACLEWLPQETILFDQARFRRKTTLDLKGNARVMAGEMIVFGRLASGEEVKSALLREAWEVKKDDQILWTDALHLQGDVQKQLNHPAAFGGARAMATALYVAPDSADHLESARALLQDLDGVKAGASLVNQVLVCRFLASEPYRLRKAYGHFWSEFRHHSLGRPVGLPRIWQC